nr:MAG TPA: hypothetical protein [Caudoviricetes sp.]
MEGYETHHRPYYSVFFILGASDGLVQNLKRIQIRVAMRLNSSIEYLSNMPISQFMELVNDIIEMDEEDRQRRQSR